MKKYIFFSGEAAKYYQILKKDLEKQIAHSVFRINCEVLKKGVFPSRIKLRNALFIITAADQKEPLFKELTRSVILRQSSGVEREGEKLYLPYPTKATASFIGMTISIFTEEVLYVKLYEDTLSTLDAYEKSAEFSRTEHLNMRRIVDAQEKNQEYSRKEQIEKDRIIQAQEQVSALSRTELLSYNKVLQAWEIFSEMIRKELIETRKESAAISTVFDLSDTEQKDKDKTIGALDRTIEMSRQERLGLDKMTHASENILEFRRMTDLDEARYIEAISEEDLGKLLGNEKIWNSLISNDKKELVEMIKALFRALLRRRHDPVATI